MLLLFLVLLVIVVPSNYSGSRRDLYDLAIRIDALARGGSLMFSLLLLVVFAGVWMNEKSRGIFELPCHFFVLE